MRKTKKGPPSSNKNVPVYANWMAAREGSTAQGAYEVPLFTDAVMALTEPLTLGITHGPYQFFPLQFRPVHDRTCGPRIMMRVQDYINEIPGRFEEARLACVADWEPHPAKEKRRVAKDDEQHHGGGLDDEVAALLSLALGIRLKPGVVSRIFFTPALPWLPEHLRNERGKPTAHASHTDPVLFYGFHTPVIPHALETIAFDTTLFATLHTLAPADVTPLVRAARLYQDGLWMAEAMPEWTWLKFISAVETAANHWQTGTESPVARLRAAPSLQRLVEILESHGGKALVTQVAPELMPYVGATKKFRDFLLTFCPDAPPVRPEAHGQFSWGRQNRKKAFDIIYDYRSKSLHAGKAFPSLLVQPPETRAGSSVPPEKPVWLSVERVNAVWDKADMPLFLHTFDYIVRQALCKWWSSMIQDSPERMPTPEGDKN